MILYNNISYIILANITINKAQGQTLRYCGINLKESCFSRGQLYVACYKVGNPKKLYFGFASDEARLN